MNNLNEEEDLEMKIRCAYNIPCTIITTPRCCCPPILRKKDANEQNPPSMENHHQHYRIVDRQIEAFQQKH